MSGATRAINSSMPGWWKRFRYSPLRDVLRGRFTGRLDVRWRIAEAGLMAPLDDVVYAVVRKTRLTRLEQIDVADELIAHFLDGLESGTEPGDLAEAFGDTKAAARLIGRAKKRNRPLLWQAWMRSVQAVGLLAGLLLVAYAALAVPFYFSKPVLSVDYRAQINQQALAVPESERAWPLYRAALMTLPQPKALRKNLSRAPRPGEVGWGRVEAALTEHASELAAVRRAARMPGLGFVTGYELSEEDQKLWPTLSFSEADFEVEGLYAILLPHLGELRKLNRLLGHDALRAASVGDGEVTLDNLEAMLGLARQVRESSFIINDLISLSMARRTFTVAGDVLATYPDSLSEAQLRRLAHVLAAYDESWLRVRFEIERIGFADIMQRLYSDDGHGDGALTAYGCKLLMRMAGSNVLEFSQREQGVMMLVGGPLLRTVMLSRREMIEQYDRFIDETEARAAIPLWQRDYTRITSRLEQWNESLYERLRHFPLLTFTPSLERATRAGDLARQHRTGILTATALTLYRRQHGQWPAGLEVLSPRYMPAIPVDSFTGGALRYAIEGDTVRVYSVGSDRDDDGGRPLDEHLLWSHLRHGVDETGRHIVEPTDGDWVLWPPLIEPIIDYSKGTPTEE